MNFIVENWQLITGAVGAIVAYFGGKKVAKSKEQQEQGTALDLMQNSYKKFVEDYELKFAEMQKEIETLKAMERENLEKVANLKGQIEQLNEARARDKSLIAELTAKVASYELRLNNANEKK